MDQEEFVKLHQKSGVKLPDKVRLVATGPHVPMSQDLKDSLPDRIVSAEEAEAAAVAWLKEPTISYESSIGGRPFTVEQEINAIDFHAVRKNSRVLRSIWRADNEAGWVEGMVF